MVSVTSINSLYLSSAAQNYADATVGPMVLGCMSNLFLFGVVVQGFVDYKQTLLYRRDSLRTKLLFWTVLLFGACEATLYVLTIYRFSTSQRRQVLCIYFYLLVGSGILIGFLGSICVSNISFMFTSGHKNLIEYLTYNQAVAMWMWASAAVDITVTLALYLTLSKHVAGFNQEMDHVLVKLMRLGLRTALPPTCLALTAEILSISFDNDNNLTCTITSAFFFPLPSLYCLSLATTLSYRATLANHLGVFTPSPLMTNGHAAFTKARNLQPTSSIPVHSASQALELSFSQMMRYQFRMNEGCGKDEEAEVMEEGRRRRDEI